MMFQLTSSLYISQKERLLRKKNSKENHFILIHTFFLISNFGQDFRFICCFLVPNQVWLSIYHLRDNPYTVNHQKNLTLKVCKNQNLFSVCEVEEDLGSIWDSFKTGVLTHFSLNLHFISKLVIWFAHKSNDWFLYEMQHWAERLEII